MPPKKPTDNPPGKVPGKQAHNADGKSGVKTSGRAGPRGNQRMVHVKDKEMKQSSRAWLQRQLNDPYVAEAHRMGYRSRAAFKLIEMDDQLKLIKPGMMVLDLGAAPGGWTQVAVERKAKVVAIDILPMDPVAGAAFLQMDFMDEDAPEVLVTALNGPVDIVLTDMAPNTMGHQKTDHIRIMNLVEAAYEFAVQVLKQDGAFLAKVFQGGTQGELLSQMKKDFKTVKHIKPPASRQGSAEQYVVARGFRRAPDAE